MKDKKNNIRTYAPAVAKVLDHLGINKSYFANGLYFDHPISRKGTEEWKKRAVMLQNKLNGARDVSGQDLESMVKFFDGFLIEITEMVNEAKDEVKVIRRKEKISSFLKENEEDEEILELLKRKGYKE